MITFIVTYDLAETQLRPDENKEFKRILSETLNGQNSITYVSFNYENEPLPDTTFLLNVHLDNVSSLQIKNSIYSLARNFNISIGKLFIAPIKTDIHSPFPNNTSYSDSLTYNLFGGYI